ncbi:MAG: conjugal transfer protein [Lachnospiraceae bacterium]|nr:conjugal transfer protein [Lachnospiraceae bacterium]
MELFAAMMNVIQTAIIAIGVGLSLYGGINLMEGYGGDNPASKSQGIKQMMAGGGIALIGSVVVPMLSGLFG